MSKTINILLFFILIGSKQLAAQDSTFVLTTAMFDKDGYLELPKTIHWQFKQGNDTAWANPNYDHSQWRKLDSLEIENIRGDDNGIFEGWFVLTFKLDSSFSMMPLYLLSHRGSPFNVYVNGKQICSFGNIDYESDNYKSAYDSDRLHNISLPINQELFVAIHFVDVRESLFLYMEAQDREPILNQNLFSLVNDKAFQSIQEMNTSNNSERSNLASAIAVFMILFWLIALLNRSQIHITYIAINVSLLFSIFFFLSLLKEVPYGSNVMIIFQIVVVPGLFLFFISFFYLITSALEIPIAKAIRIFIGVLFLFLIPIILFWRTIVPLFFLVVSISLFGLISYYIIRNRKRIKGARKIIIAGPIVMILAFLAQILAGSLFGYNLFGRFIFILWLIFPTSLLVYISFWLKEMMVSIEDKAMELVQASSEKKEILENQNVVLERQVLERTEKLNTSLENLKATQSQLIQSEKMASLGELTAGIAHEIQNPLNFVNNFSEVNTELIREIQDERRKTQDERDEELETELLQDIAQNQEKVLHHGKRADAIVKGMLQHSRTSSGQKEPTDINALCDEYLRLSYHGLRAKDKSFNAKFETDFDSTLPKLNVVPQDIGRVVLNLINNAFYATSEKLKVESKKSGSVYEPLVTVSTKATGDKIQISVKDNGNGIPDSIREKIFQPFFTTKPTGQGTGLGLSLSYDIVKAHGGTIDMESRPMEGTEFKIKIPEA